MDHPQHRSLLCLELALSHLVYLHPLLTATPLAMDDKKHPTTMNLVKITVSLDSSHFPSKQDHALTVAFLHSADPDVTPQGLILPSHRDGIHISFTFMLSYLRWGGNFS